MAKDMNLSEQEIKKIKDAGYLHDIGKIALDTTVNGDNERAEEEIKEMEHPAVGYRILHLFDNTLDLADAVYSHHENWNGTGYPKGLRGQEIPLTSRIIALAESYDRIMLTDALNPSEKKLEAIQHIRDNAGKKFDPNLVEIFLKLVQ
jgi:putative nucleotidyltransferase with HDIG domain